METYERLENEFSDFVGMNRGEMVACSSGTAALHLAFEALRLPQGSKVLMSDFNMIACPRAATLASLRPIFVDCNGDDLLLSETEVGIALDGGDDVSAILATHIYGRKVGDWLHDPTTAAADVVVVEDMAEIHGVAPNKRSDAACWSFYKNKIIAGEEGGMVWFNDPAIAKAARELRSLGFSPKHDYTHRPRGHNYRLSNCHAELILKSLLAYSTNRARRNKIENLYNSHIPVHWQMPLRNAVWVYDLRIPGLGYNRMSFIVRELNVKGIAARHGFKPMTSQEEYRMSGIENVQAYKASQEVLYLPVYPTMAEREVVANVSELLKAYDFGA